MRTLLLKRISYTEGGTFGVLLDVYKMASEYIPFALTCEREWLDNRPDVSCIPTGEYICKRVNSPRFGNTFEVMYVNGRTSILFHSGNTEDDSKGCILVGEEFGVVNGKMAVLSSKRGFAEFLERVKAVDEFMLVIRGCA